MKIGTKMLAGFLSVLVIFAAAVTFTFVRVRKMEAEVQDDIAGDILERVAGAAEGVQEVVASGQQMSAGVQNVAATAQEQNAAMEEVSAISDNLAKMAEELRTFTGKFKV